MYDSIDRDLQYRMRGVVPFLKSHSLSTPEAFRKTFENSPDSAVVGVFIQITDSHSTMLYQSELLELHHISALPRAPEDSTVSWGTFGMRTWQIRAASKRVVIDGQELNIHVIEPLKDLLSSLHQLTLYLALLLPFALVLAAGVGSWIGRHALAPVEQIRQAADAIDPADMTTRLAMPETNDELGKLTRTLNSMLSRIEAGFRTVEQFTADASHELRAPLAYIITTGDVMLRRPRSREELEDAIRKLLQEARRMSKLVERMLTLARGDARQISMPFETIDLRSLLEEAMLQVQENFIKKKILLQQELTEEPATVTGVSSELRSLILILLHNALKYTDAGVVRVTLVREQTSLALSVQDTGIGIATEDLPLVFDRFWRADKVRSRAESGAGLGLSIASQIVQRHQGSIAVDSLLGQGSTFLIHLPSK